MALLVIGALVAAGAAVLTRGDAGGHTPNFGSDAEFTDFLRARERVLAQVRGQQYSDDAVALEIAAPADSAAAPQVRVAPDDEITNVQEIGVDEGGLVKARGDLLIVLRRGRLFTLSTAGGGLRAVDRIDAFPPSADMREAQYSAWYDEMLVVGDRVVVIGYDYGRTPDQGGTQVVRFKLSREGDLSFEDAYQIKSFDYFSAENFASRLIGDTLVLYSPLPLYAEEDGRIDAARVMPGMRRLGTRTPQPFQPIARRTDIHIAPQMRADPTLADTLHAVSRCDLGSAPMRCEATGVVSSETRSFYVSRDAIYLWTAAYQDRGSSAASVYRLPLDGAAPSAIQADGVPQDQFSFRESDGALDVVVQTEGRGDGMWSGLDARGRTRLVHLPLSRFGDGSQAARAGDYRDLPVPDGWMRQNRFVGDHVLVSSGDDYGDDAHGVLVIAPVRGGKATSLNFASAVTRIEPLGRDALAVTGENGATLNLIQLSNQPSVMARLEVGGVGEADSRSHGFFFRADPNSNGERGLMALPILRPLLASADHVIGQAVDMVFVRRNGDRLARTGQLGASSRQVADHCLVSCVDWYGDARPIFLNGRMFALLGYELVEGREENGRIVEVRRLDFTPRG